MKFSLLFTLLSLAHISSAQVVNIPDFNFKNYLLNHPGINTNGDNEIQESEAAAFADSIICPNANILSITGISAFTNLTFLNVALNSISSINVYQNTQLETLIFPFNDVTTISLGTNANLKEVVCWENLLTDIDVSYNPALTRLEINSNSISSLDLSQNPNLERLFCSSNNIGSLDLSIHSNLNYLECNGSGLSALDVTNNPLLTHVECMGNSIGVFDFSQNPLLEVAKCDFNNMTSLDLSSNSNLNRIGCFGCSNLVTLNVQNGNNANFAFFQANNNPNLTCVQVDDVAYSVANWTNIDASSVFSLACATSIDEPSASVVKCYPNPFNETLIVESDVKIDKINVRALDGKSVLVSDVHFNQTKIVLDVSELSEGMYCIETLLENGRLVLSRLVK